MKLVSDPRHKCSDLSCGQWDDDTGCCVYLLKAFLYIFQFYNFYVCYVLRGASSLVFNARLSQALRQTQHDCWVIVKNSQFRTSLVVQGLRICLSMQETQRWRSRVACSHRAPVPQLESPEPRWKVSQWPRRPVCLRKQLMRSSDLT